MMHKVLLVLACAAVTGGLWFLLERTHPIFVAEEAMAAGRDAGGLTEEWINDIRTEDLKSAMVTYSLWGAVLAGFCGLLCNPRAHRRAIGLGVGVGLGALAGGLAAYGGQWHDLAVEYTGSTTTYWIVRWSILAIPLAIAAAIACAASGDFSKDAVDSLAGSLIGAVIGVTVISLLMGVVTPVESHQNIFPGFSSSRGLALAAVNLSVVGLLILQLGRQPAGKLASSPASTPTAT
jgi:hypothetical protein